MMWKAHDDKKLTQAGNGKDHSIHGNVYDANWYDRYQIKFIVQKQIKPLGHNIIGFVQTSNLFLYESWKNEKRMIWFIRKTLIK